MEEKTFKLVKDFIDINEFSRPGQKLKSFHGIVIHYTADRFATAKNVRDYFNNLKKQEFRKQQQKELEEKLYEGKGDSNYLIKEIRKLEITGLRYAGTQFVTDWNETIQTMEEDDVAYHVGAWKYRPGIQKKIGNYPNNHLIGIEVCFKSENGKFDKETIENLCCLVSYLMNKYNFGIERIYRHFDITGKSCPKYYVDNELEWQRLLKTIEDFDKKYTVRVNK